MESPLPSGLVEHTRTLRQRDGKGCALTKQQGWEIVRRHPTELIAARRRFRNHSRISTGRCGLDGKKVALHTSISTAAIYTAWQRHFVLEFSADSSALRIAHRIAVTSAYRDMAYRFHACTHPVM